MLFESEIASENPKAAKFVDALKFPAPFFAHGIGTVFEPFLESPRAVEVLKKASQLHAEGYVFCDDGFVIGVAYIRDAVIIGFIANELISIVKNAGLMGVPIPEIIVKSIEVLKNKAEKEDG